MSSNEDIIDDKSEKYNTLRNAIKNKLNDDMPASDIKWSMFVGALLSYRHSSILRPFPRLTTQSVPSELEDLTSSHYSYLVKVVDRVPKFCYLRNPQNLDQLDDEAVELLHWCLCKMSYDLQSCDSSVYNELIDKAKQDIKVQQPSAIFKVSYSNSGFENRASDKKLLHAFHGSRFDNFHSILSFGLQGSLNKNSLFGDGTYLSNELSVAFSYCPLGQSWTKSEYGSSISCVAYCDIIDNNLVKYGTDRTSPSDVKTPSSKNRVKGSLGGAVPQKYFLVQNSDMLRVRYVLVYSTASITPNTSSSSSSSSANAVGGDTSCSGIEATSQQSLDSSSRAGGGDSNRRLSAQPAQQRGQPNWLSKNKSFAGALVYVMLLVVVSIYSSDRLQMFMRRLHRRYFGHTLL